MLDDMGHPFADGEEVYDVTFENVQAGLRTDYLFRIANQRGGIVLGTGDLSELALGWCTYGVGDQMSHYTVNTGVPKTLIQHLIRWVVDSEQFGVRDDEVNELLTEIVGAGDHPRAGPDPGGREAAAHRGIHRPLRAARLHALPRAAATASGRARSPSWPSTPGPTRGRASGRRTTRRSDAAGVRPADDPALARGVRQAVLRQPVQALGAAQRPEGERRRHDVAAR